jgi:CRISPR-associated protein Cmr2
LVEEEHSGKVIYCGGDDVLALLPVDEALPCAEQLRVAYEGCFSEDLRRRTGLSFTISAAVVFAHMNTALRSVVQDAHRLLDEVAKEELGRNAFAVRVWKRGGPILTWGKPWGAPSWANELQWLKDSIGERTDAEGGSGVFSNRFIYRVRELFDLLQPRDEAGARLGPELPEEVQAQLLLAEHRSTRRAADGRTKEEDEQDIRRFLALCREGWNEEGQPRSGAELRPEAALLARFLGQKEV